LKNVENSKKCSNFGKGSFFVKQENNRNPKWANPHSLTGGKEDGTTNVSYGNGRVMCQIGIALTRVVYKSVPFLRCANRTNFTARQGVGLLLSSLEQNILAGALFGCNFFPLKLHQKIYLHTYKLISRLYDALKLLHIDDLVLKTHQLFFSDASVQV
jgi:hypothetical protein